MVRLRDERSGIEVHSEDAFPKLFTVNPVLLWVVEMKKSLLSLDWREMWRWRELSCLSFHCSFDRNGKNGENEKWTDYQCSLKRMSEGGIHVGGRVCVPRDLLCFPVVRRLLQILTILDSPVISFLKCVLVVLMEVSLSSSLAWKRFYSSEQASSTVITEVMSQCTHRSFDATV